MSGPHGSGVSNAEDCMRVPMGSWVVCTPLQEGVADEALPGVS